MKIPTTPPGGAPYYPGPPINGMEINPPWQGNGVIVDGSAPGNGAPYVHMQHMHPAGYVPPPGYYGPNSPPVPAPGPAPAGDFSEYMWMEDMEAFDEEVMHQLEEEALMEQCVEAMLEDEREAQRNINTQNVNEHPVDVHPVQSTLNPLAAEFVPKFALAAAAAPPAPPAEPASETTSEQASTSDAVKSLETSVAQISISNENSTDATDGAKPSKSPSPSVSEEKKSPKDEEIVVVSAKDTVKTAREQKVEKKQNKDVKKKDEPVKVQKENSKPVAKPKSPSVEVVETKPIVKEEAPPVDLQGPPLPTPAALVAAPVAIVEPEPKPAAPAVFNYAAAAKANLPPKQPAPAAQPTPAAPPKPEIIKETPSEVKTANAPRPRQAQKPGGHKQAAPVKKGKK